MPELFIMAGAPGSGKSRSFPVSEFGVDFFNADDRAAELNGGSYHNIPLDIRAIVNREFEAFIAERIAKGISFALETTLRSQITFDQILSAKRNGFEVTMRYLGTADIETNLKRIKVRFKRGFHAAPIDVLMAIHAKSLENLKTACAMACNGDMRLLLYDNSAHNKRPKTICAISLTTVRILQNPLPAWAAACSVRKRRRLNLESPDCNQLGSIPCPSSAT